MPAWVSSVSCFFSVEFLVNTCGCSLLHLLQLVRLTARSSTCSIRGVSTEKEGRCQFPGSNSLEEEDETFKCFYVDPETFSRRNVLEYGSSWEKYILVTGVRVARKRHSASLEMCFFGSLELESVWSRLLAKLACCVKSSSIQWGRTCCTHDAILLRDDGSQQLCKISIPWKFLLFNISWTWAWSSS